MSFATLRRTMYKLDMKLRRSEAKPKAHQVEKAEPKRMSFTEIMRLVTKRPVVDHRPQWIVRRINAE